MRKYQPMRTKQLLEWWSAGFAVTLAVTIASILWLDIPIARHFFAYSAHVAALAQGLGTKVVVGGDAVLMILLGVFRILRGGLPRYGRAAFMACAASLSAFAANDYVLKPIFGRYGPYTYLGNPGLPLFNFFRGDLNCVFPSGHMVLSTAFAAVLIRAYPRSWPIFAGLLGLASVLLLIGDWHFLSDIIAGIFVGGTVGMLMCEVWRRHLRPTARA
jgi:membrane-associated phospholipid phosphatase